MSKEIKNRNLTLKFHLPDEGYNGTRFSAVGKLVEVRFDGISCATNELKSGFSAGSGAGFYNEFDIDTALGYDEVEKGEWFHKIGVGLLKKDDDKYDFFKSYEVIPAEVEVDCSKEQISFKAIQKEYNGYGYELNQTYVLNEIGFTIQYTLKNTGSKVIKTAEYNHNFLQIDRHLIDGNYQLKFNPEVQLSPNSEFVNPNDSVDFNSKRMTFNSNPASDFFMSDLQSMTSVDLCWELELNKGISIKSTTDKTPSKMNIWGTGHVISPELFIELSIEPAETSNWSRNYQFKRL